MACEQLLDFIDPDSEHNENLDKALISCCGENPAPFNGNSSFKMVISVKRK